MKLRESSKLWSTWSELYQVHQFQLQLQLQYLSLVVMEDLKTSKEPSMLTSNPLQLLSPAVMISLKVRLETISMMVEVTCMMEETSWVPISRRISSTPLVKSDKLVPLVLALDTIPRSTKVSLWWPLKTFPPTGSRSDQITVQMDKDALVHKLSNLVVTHATISESLPLETPVWTNWWFSELKLDKLELKTLPQM